MRASAGRDRAGFPKEINPQLQNSRALQPARTLRKLAAVRFPITVRRLTEGRTIGGRSYHSVKCEIFVSLGKQSLPSNVARRGGLRRTPLNSGQLLPT
jgi:hypothetical protein